MRLDSEAGTRSNRRKQIRICHPIRAAGLPGTHNQSHLKGAGKEVHLPAPLTLNLSLLLNRLG